PLHRKVGDDHVKETGLDLFQRLFAGLRGLDLVAFFGEQAFERDDDSALVVDDEQSALHCTSRGFVRCVAIGSGASVDAFPFIEIDVVAGESASGSVASAGVSRTASASGIDTRNSVPTPSPLVTSMVPRCASITFLATPSPRPVPFCFGV